MSLSEIFKNQNLRAVNKVDGTLKITLSNSPVAFAEKRCPRCRVVKLLTDFYVGSGKYGRATYCKNCEKMWQKADFAGR